MKAAAFCSNLLSGVMHIWMNTGGLVGIPVPPDQTRAYLDLCTGAGQEGRGGHQEHGGGRGGHYGAGRRLRRRCL